MMLMLMLRLVIVVAPLLLTAALTTTFTTQSSPPPPLVPTERYQNKRVRRTLGLSDGAIINATVWNKYLALRPDVRAEIACQTSWPPGQMGAKIAGSYFSLSDQIHVHQLGNRTVTILDQNLPWETCLGTAAYLDDFVELDFDPPALRVDFERNRRAAGLGPTAAGWESND